MSPIVLVHGIFNYIPGIDSEAAAAQLAATYRPCLAEGLGRLSVPTPEVAMAYYADLLQPDSPRWAQAVARAPGFESLRTEQQRADAAQWLVAAGFVEPENPMGEATRFLRDWLTQLVDERGGRLSRAARRLVVDRVERAIVSHVHEVEAYTSQPDRRALVRARVADLVRREAPAVVIAHSLGSYITYEALHAYPDLEVELLVTVGSPLRVPSLLRRLDPPLRSGRGARPAGVQEWVNIADVGDPVAVPPKLGEVFPVDSDETCDNGFDAHGLGGYLSNDLLAGIIAPHLS
ncbi:hypothetical protein ACFW96_30455 [Streptomyces gardneri]|uniref:hypothetical protein n=1 Tax=Streptomyces gardneri TaxID=66892 RepID=UPI003697881C